MRSATCLISAPAPPARHRGPSSLLRVCPCGDFGGQAPSRSRRPVQPFPRRARQVLSKSLSSRGRGAAAPWLTSRSRELGRAGLHAAARSMCVASVTPSSWLQPPRVRGTFSRLLPTGPGAAPGLSRGIPQSQTRPVGFRVGARGHACTRVLPRVTRAAQPRSPALWRPVKRHGVAQAWPPSPRTRPAGTWGWRV